MGPQIIELVLAGRGIVQAIAGLIDQAAKDDAASQAEIDAARSAWSASRDRLDAAFDEAHRRLNN